MKSCASGDVARISHPDPSPSTTRSSAFWRADLMGTTSPARQFSHKTGATHGREEEDRSPSLFHGGVRHYFCSLAPDEPDAAPPLAQNSIRSDLEITPRRPSGPLTAMAVWPPTSAV